MRTGIRRCFQYIKDTKKKANHNYQVQVLPNRMAVSNTSKILKRKQITTTTSTPNAFLSCFQNIKDTKKKANHNQTESFYEQTTAVSNTSKILKRKQITTKCVRVYMYKCCFQYIKDTKKKANHNVSEADVVEAVAVSNTSKILKRKQITTSGIR